jgi:hypothetical protein
MSVIPTDFTSFLLERASSASAIPVTDSKPAVIDAASSLVYDMILVLTNLNFIDPPPREFLYQRSRKRAKASLSSVNNSAVKASVSLS